MSMSGHIGGQLEFQWFHMLEREVRRLGGAPDLIRRVFQDPKKITQLATFLLSLEGRTAAYPADQAEPPLTPPS